MEGKWLSVLEFAAYKKKSISTIRRYIKANRVKFKEDAGKYYIFVKNFEDEITTLERRTLELQLENERLKKENRFLNEELSEVKMLITIYESKQEPQLPTLPNEL